MGKKKKKKMVRSDDLYLTVPTFFRCPISLDVMKSPVSLCTGVTYDRSSIQAWLDTGHNTCPATMQVLPSTDFVPNLTLHSLIQQWSVTTSSDPSSSGAASSSALPASLTPDAALLLLRRLDPDPASSLRQLHRFASESDRNRKLLVDSGCVGLVASFLAAASGESKMDAVEAGVGLLRVLIEYKEGLSEEDEKAVLGPGFWSVLLLALQKGGLECRVAAAKAMESILAGNGEGKKAVPADTKGILLELMRLSGWEADVRAVDAGLAALLAVATSARSVRSQIAGSGGVPLLARLLERPEATVVERALALLEALSSCPDGRAAIGANPACVPAMVDRILKASGSATERAVAVLWSLCCAYRDDAARERVARSNAARKMLLLLQSNCSPPVRRMAGDLLKLVRQAGGANGCLTSYQTKSTHIMPF